MEESEASLGRTFDLNIFGLDPQRHRVAVLFTDITERKQVERALRESEERLRQFGEASQDVLWVRDATTLQWQYLSPAFETIYGLSRKEALMGDNYRNWQDLILPADQAHAIDSLTRVARGEQVVFEYRIRRPDDGRIRWLRDTDFPMGGDNGTAPRIGGVGQDITEAKIAEEALAAAEQRQRLLLEGMPQLVWRAVADGRWTWASPQWIVHTGLDDARSQGHGWLDALHPDDREVALAAWAQAQVEGAYQVEYRILNIQSGLYQWFQTRGTPICRTDGSVVEWLGTSTDIDEQVRAREFLRRAGIELEQRVDERTAELQQALDTLHREVREHEQAEERLRQSEKLKAVRQLTGGIAHDFNNMLQGITSALALVRARLAQGRIEAAQEFIVPAEKAATRAGALTHRLLAFSRQQTLAPKALTLDQIAREMEDMIRRSVGPSVQVELKSADGHWLVLCDPNQMESALLNLCINARDAMPEGGWLTISTEERVLSEREVMGFEELRPGRYAALGVTDTGTGMTPEVAARVFEPFFTTKSQGQGTGLGLSQIYGFIRQSGGLVQVETALGKGTTVRLCLPFHEMSVEEPLEKLINGKTILLVEDEHDLRRMLGAQLRDLGYAVVEAETAEVALRVLSTGSRIDLLVTDIGLRGELNGRQLIKAARDKLSDLPVILITGYASDNTFHNEVVLRKPFKPAVLALLVREQIG